MLHYPKKLGNYANKNDLQRNIIAPFEYKRGVGKEEACAAQ